jgi:hypothetical protein
MSEKRVSPERVAQLLRLDQHGCKLFHVYALDTRYKYVDLIRVKEGGLFVPESVLTNRDAEFVLAVYFTSDQSILYCFIPTVESLNEIRDRFSVTYEGDKHGYGVWLDFVHWHRRSIDGVATRIAPADAVTK